MFETFFYIKKRMYCTQNVTKLKTVKFLITYLITDFMEQKKKVF